LDEKELELERGASAPATGLKHSIARFSVQSIEKEPKGRKKKGDGIKKKRERSVAPKGLKAGAAGGGKQPTRKKEGERTSKLARRKNTNRPNWGKKETG